jgi:hypothetical protein
VRPTDGLFIPAVRGTKLCIYRLISRNARLSTNRSEPRKTVGGGVYYTRPSLPISIMYKQDGAGIRVKLVGRKRCRESTPGGHDGRGGQRSPKRNQIDRMFNVGVTILRKAKSCTLGILHHNCGYM